MAATFDQSFVGLGRSRALGVGGGQDGVGVRFRPVWRMRVEVSAPPVQLIESLD